MTEQACTGIMIEGMEKSEWANNIFITLNNLEGGKEQMNAMHMYGVQRTTCRSWLSASTL